MKKQLNPTIKAHLIRGAFYLLLLLAVCAIPFALAQRNATKRAVINPAAKIDACEKYMSQVSQRTDGAVSDQPLPNISRTGQSQVPTKHSEPGVPSFRITPVPKFPAVTLYDQLNNAGTVSTGSQDFEAVFDAFDDFTADDFVVPAGQTWNITEVDVQGVYFNGPGPAASFHVFIYQNSCPCRDSVPASPTLTRHRFLHHPNRTVVLTAGTYWVSVQARMDFTPAVNWVGPIGRCIEFKPHWKNPGAALRDPGGNGWLRKANVALVVSRPDVPAHRDNRRRHSYADSDGDTV